MKKFDKLYEKMIKDPSSGNAEAQPESKPSVSENGSEGYMVGLFEELLLTECEAVTAGMTLNEYIEREELAERYEEVIDKMMVLDAIAYHRRTGGYAILVEAFGEDWPKFGGLDFQEKVDRYLNDRFFDNKTQKWDKAGLEGFRKELQREVSINDSAIEDANDELTGKLYIVVNADTNAAVKDAVAKPRKEAQSQLDKLKKKFKSANLKLNPVEPTEKYEVVDEMGNRQKRSDGVERMSWAEASAFADELMKKDDNRPRFSVVAIPGRMIKPGTREKEARDKEITEDIGPTIDEFMVELFEANETESDKPDETDELEPAYRVVKTENGKKSYVADKDGNTIFTNKAAEWLMLAQQDKYPDKMYVVREIGKLPKTDILHKKRFSMLGMIREIDKIVDNLKFKGTRVVAGFKQYAVFNADTGEILSGEKPLLQDEANEKEEELKQEYMAQEKTPPRLVVLKVTEAGLKRAFEEEKEEEGFKWNETVEKQIINFVTCLDQIPVYDKLIDDLRDAADTNPEYDYPSVLSNRIGELRDMLKGANGPQSRRLHDEIKKIKKHIDSLQGLEDVWDIIRHYEDARENKKERAKKIVRSLEKQGMENISEDNLRAIAAELKTKREKTRIRARAEDKEDIEHTVKKLTRQNTNPVAARTEELTQEDFDVLKAKYQQYTDRVKKLRRDITVKNKELNASDGIKRSAAREKLKELIYSLNKVQKDAEHIRTQIYRARTNEDISKREREAALRVDRELKNDGMKQEEENRYVISFLKTQLNQRYSNLDKLEDDLAKHRIATKGGGGAELKDFEEKIKETLEDIDEQESQLAILGVNYRRPPKLLSVEDVRPFPFPTDEQIKKLANMGNDVDDLITRTSNAYRRAIKRSDYLAAERAAEEAEIGLQKAFSEHGILGRTIEKISNGKKSYKTGSINTPLDVGESLMKSPHLEVIKTLNLDAAKKIHDRARAEMQEAANKGINRWAVFNDANKVVAGGPEFTKEKAEQDLIKVQAKYPNQKFKVKKSKRIRDKDVGSEYQRAMELIREIKRKYREKRIDASFQNELWDAIHKRYYQVRGDEGYEETEKELLDLKNLIDRRKVGRQGVNASHYNKLQSGDLDADDLSGANWDTDNVNLMKKLEILPDPREPAKPYLESHDPDYFGKFKTLVQRKPVTETQPSEFLTNKAIKWLVDFIQGMVYENPPKEFHIAWKLLFLNYIQWIDLMAKNYAKSLGSSSEAKFQASGVRRIMPCILNFREQTAGWDRPDVDVELDKNTDQFTRYLVSSVAGAMKNESYRIIAGDPSSELEDPLGEEYNELYLKNVAASERVENIKSTIKALEKKRKGIKDTMMRSRVGASDVKEIEGTIDEWLSVLDKIEDVRDRYRTLQNRYSVKETRPPDVVDDMKELEDELRKLKNDENKYEDKISDLVQLYGTEVDDLANVKQEIDDAQEVLQSEKIVKAGTEKKLKKFNKTVPRPKEGEKFGMVSLDAIRGYGDDDRSLYSKVPGHDPEVYNEPVDRALEIKGVALMVNALNELETGEGAEDEHEANKMFTYSMLLRYAYGVEMPKKSVEELASFKLTQQEKKLDLEQSKENVIRDAKRKVSLSLLDLNAHRKAWEDYHEEYWDGYESVFNNVVDAIRKNKPISDNVEPEPEYEGLGKIQAKGPGLDQITGIADNPFQFRELYKKEFSKKDEQNLITPRTKADEGRLRRSTQKVLAHFKERTEKLYNAIIANRNKKFFAMAAKKPGIFGEEPGDVTITLKHAHAVLSAKMADIDPELWQKLNDYFGGQKNETIAKLFDSYLEGFKQTREAREAREKAKRAKEKAEERRLAVQKGGKSKETGKKPIPIQGKQAKAASEGEDIAEMPIDDKDEFDIKW
jgi:hypothetical protein